MSEQAEDFAPPRIALVCGGVLAALAFVAALAGSYGDVGVSRASQSPVVESRLLKIENASDFSAKVSDARDGRLIHIAKLGPEEGFIWGAVNGLSYSRKQLGGALDAPYDLARRADGKLTLTDTVSGKTIILNSFGKGNAAAFGRLFERQQVSQEQVSGQQVSGRQVSGHLEAAR